MLPCVKSLKFKTSLESESEPELQNSSSENENETLASPSKNEEFCTQTASPTKLGNLYYCLLHCIAQFMVHLNVTEFPNPGPYILDNYIYLIVSNK